MESVFSNTLCHSVLLSSFATPQAQSNRWSCWTDRQVFARNTSRKASSLIAGTRQYGPSTPESASWQRARRLTVNVQSPTMVSMPQRRRTMPSDHGQGEHEPDSRPWPPRGHLSRASASQGQQLPSGRGAGGLPP